MAAMEHLRTNGDTAALRKIAKRIPLKLNLLR